MLNAEIVESNEQYISIWKVLAGDRAGADLIDKAGIAVCWAESPFPFWNALFLTERMADAAHLRQRLRTAAEYMRARQHPGLVYVCEDYLRDEARLNLDTAVRDAGLEFSLDVFGMVADILPFDRPASHPELRFERATDEEALRAYADINSEGYGFPLEAGRAGLEGSALWKERGFAYIGYLDGKAVSTAAAFENEGQLYLALVATRPDMQRRGFGEATVRRALEAAHEATGLRRTSLHATRAGSPVYERVGYRRVTRFICYGRST
jgi:GNAT superfamily N-acetyltransferase